MEIAGLKPSKNVLLAPMAGVTDLPMRELAMELGANLAVGEMQSSNPQLRNSRKTEQRRKHTTEAGPNSVQIVGFDPSQLAEAASFNASCGADIIDINMGCPAKKVCRKLAGSALLGDELLVSRILESVVRAVKIPVTLKMRTGTNYQNRNGPAIAKIAEEAGVKMLTVHGRTREDRFLGAAEYETIRHIVDTVSIPVIANGDINNIEKARYVLLETGAAGVMIGRAAQGRLWLPGAISKALDCQSGRISAPSIIQQFEIQERHLKALYVFHGHDLGVRIARKHMVWFLNALVEQDSLGNAKASDQRKAFQNLETSDMQLRHLSALATNLSLTDGTLAT